MAKQVKGGQSRIVMYPETGLKTPAMPAVGVVVPFLSESFKQGVNKQTKATIRGKRGVGAPFRDAPQLSGGMELPANVHLMGHVLRALCGAPVTTPVAAIAISEAAVTDRGGGLVGLPAPAHGLQPDAVITVLGTAGYNGSYRVELETTADEVVINAGAYVPEVVGAGAAIRRGRVRKLKAADVVDAGGGTVLLPCPGHGMNSGETVTVTGTVNYDGSHVLAQGTTPDQLAITAGYTAETLDGTETVAPEFFRHAFTLPDEQPSVTVERMVPFESGAAYDRYVGVKIDGLSVNITGSGQLTVSLEMPPCALRTASAPLGTAAQLPDVDFDQMHVAFYDGAVRLGDVQSGSLSATFGIEGVAGIGDHGEISKQNEGDPDCKGQLTLFLTGTGLHDKAMQDVPVQFGLAFYSVGGDELVLTYPEAQLATDGRNVEGTGGLTQQFTVMGYVDQSDTALTATLINRVATY
jgi:hypothetical protein